MKSVILPGMILVLLAAVLWMQARLLRRGRIRVRRWDVAAADGRPLPRTSPRHPEGAGAEDPAMYGRLRAEVRTVSDALDRQALQLNALRTDFRERLHAIEDQLRRMAPAPAPAAAAPPPASFAPPPAAPPPASFAPAAGDDWLSAVETHAVLPASPPPPLAAPSSGTPVEVRDGVLVVSQSLPPAAFLVREGTRAQLFLNADVEINEYALPKWEAFFDLRGARPYATYRTLRAAEVSWDTLAERGTPARRGIAEAV